eukprot:701863-Prymnesium_polylepis.2
MRSARRCARLRGWLCLCPARSRGTQWWPDRLHPLIRAILGWISRGQLSPRHSGRPRAPGPRPCLCAVLPSSPGSCLPFGALQVVPPSKIA